MPGRLRVGVSCNPTPNNLFTIFCFSFLLVLQNYNYFGTQIPTNELHLASSLQLSALKPVTKDAQLPLHKNKIESGGKGEGEQDNTECGLSATPPFERIERMKDIQEHTLAMQIYPILSHLRRDAYARE